MDQFRRTCQCMIPKWIAMNFPVAVAVAEHRHGLFIAFARVGRAGARALLALRPDPLRIKTMQGQDCKVVRVPAKPVLPWWQSPAIQARLGSQFDPIRSRRWRAPPLQWRRIRPMLGKASRCNE